MPFSHTPVGLLQDTAYLPWLFGASLGWFALSILASIQTWAYMKHPLDKAARHASACPLQWPADIHSSIEAFGNAACGLGITSC